MQTMHLKNIYIEDEMDETATTEDFSVIQQEGKTGTQRKALRRILELAR